jgi:hypothetical protein
LTTGLVGLSALVGALAFAAAPALAAAPAVVSQSVPSFTPYEARLEATVNAGEEAAGKTTECSFEYGVGSISEHKVPCEQGTPAGTLEGGEQGVSLNVTVPAPGTPLTPGTLYHYRVVVKNAKGEVKGTGKAAEEEFTTLTLKKPATESESASVKDSEATLNAQVNPEYQETSCEFEYGTDASLATHTTVKCAPEFLGNSGGGVGTSITVKSLNADETYYYRVLATNGTGTTTDPAIETFTTVPVPVTDPVIVASVGKTTAKLRGHVTLNPLNTTVTTQFSFDYNPSAAECVNGPTISAGEAAPGSGLVPEEKEVTELQPNATYSVCFATSNPYGSEVDPNPSLVQFKTLPAPPEVVPSSESISEVTPSGARLEASVNANNEEVTTCEFQYEAEEPSLTTPTTIPCEQATLAGVYGGQSADLNVTGLAPGVIYYYRVVAESGTPPATDGTIESFTTQGVPLVSTGAAENMTRTTATLSGTVNPAGAETTYYFAYISEAGYQAALAKGAGGDPYVEGETTAPLTLTATEVVERNGKDVIVPAEDGYETRAVGPLLTGGLLPDTTYRYALIAKNIAGMTIGPDETLRTLSGTPPIVSTGGVSGVSQNSATLSGTVSTNSLQTNYGFEIGTEPGNYGPATGLGSIGGATTEAVSVTLGELQPGTTYYYRVEASNADGTVQGAPQSFTTPGFPTLVTIPTAPPLVATPQVAFPTGSQANTGTGATPKALTKAEKLKKALKACHAKRGKKRSSCEAAAHRKFGSVKRKGKK